MSTAFSAFNPKLDAAAADAATVPPVVAHSLVMVCKLNGQLHKNGEKRKRENKTGIIMPAASIHFCDSNEKNGK